MVEIENRVLSKDDLENEVDEKEKTPFDNFIQGLHNIDTAMEAMIDNYTDGVEHLGEENGLQDKDDSIFGKIKHNDKATEDPKSTPTLGQLETPLTDDSSSTTTAEHDLQLAKGPLSGIVGQTTSAPATSTPATAGLGGSTLPFGGLPTGIPGAGALSQGDGGGSSPTLFLGAFSVLAVPMRGGMNLGNVASMLSAGQQLGQMVPKPGGG